MFETLLIKIFGTQPVAKVTDNSLERIIQRDFGNDTDEVKRKLERVFCGTHTAKNRISAAIIKLANSDLYAIDLYIDMSKNDFRDVIAKAEYPRCSEFEFSEVEESNMKSVYLNDWREYSNWLNH